jgi:Na+/H+ antiporter NhaC
MTPEDANFLSVLPALVAIGLAFATRRVIPALFLGIVTGGLVLWWHTGDINAGNFVNQLLLPALGSKGYAQILIIYLWCLGGLIGIWERSGGALHFAKVVGQAVAKGPRSSLFFAWMLGCIFHQGGTVSTVLTGATVKPVADKHRVSHEELSYVVDSTASPVATIIPFNAWPAYVAGLVMGTIPLLPEEDIETALSFFFWSIPYNFYAIFALLFTLLFSLGLLPVFGSMAAARKRARETGQLDAPGAQPVLPSDEDLADLKRVPGYAPSLLDFFIPIGVLLSLAVIPKVVFGVNLINEAFMACLLSAVAVSLARGMSLGDVIDGVIDGCKNMTIGALILGLAVTIGFVAKELNTAAYIVSLLGESFPAMALPGALALLCMGIAFSCGTSWGTYAVVFPVAMPLAYSLNTDPTFLHICFGAVLGGAVFGDQCSPISDTTILSSMFTGCDLMDHVNTQLPLALVAAALGVVASTLCVVLLV